MSVNTGQVRREYKFRFNVHQFASVMTIFIRINQTTSEGLGKAGGGKISGPVVVLWLEALSFLNFGIFFASESTARHRTIPNQL